MTMAVDIRSDAARRANETRRTKSDIAILRDHFASAPKSEARERTVAFLAEFTRPGGLVGDLLGPGWSAGALTAAGLDVLAVDDLDWPTKKLGTRVRARVAAEELTRQIGCRLHVGQFSEVIGQIASANYDACGPYADNFPTHRDVVAMAKAGLDCFAVTVELSRNPGMADRGLGQYDVLHRGLFRRDARAYRLWDVIRYAGQNNVPMAVFLLVRFEFVRGRKTWLRIKYEIERGRTRNTNPAYRAWREAWEADRRRTPEYREYHKAYQAAHPEAAKEARRRWRSKPENREKDRAYARAYAARPDVMARRSELALARRSSPEYKAKAAERSARRRQDPTYREYMSEYGRQYRATNSDRLREQKRKWAAAKRAALRDARGGTR